ncbi:odorant receptor 22c-like isoform X2 [Linepithema humile]|uniref:odorant receptor 22c-like isoform X2 n=1 Tax=Linepithema humile TaxID=83485 RepID=UPI00351F4D47
MCSRSVCYTRSTHVEVGQVMQVTELTRASNIIIWNRWFLTCLGIWPTKVNQFLFLVFIGYMITYSIMAVNHLINHINYPEHVVANLAANILLVMILGKMCVCRRSCGIMADKFLKVIEKDFLTESYDSAQEKTAYLRYNHIALLFVKLSMTMTSTAATLYYCKVFFINWNTMVSGNFTFDELPYPVDPFFEVKDSSTYTYVCIYLALAVPLIICGYCAPDAYVLSMTFHICGQLAALSCKIDILLKDRENYHRHISNIIIRHHQLIALAEILENNFNLMFLQQTLGTVFLLCLTIYHVLAMSEYGADINLITFILYTGCVLSTILAYCYVGECLINESAGLRETFYNSEWYSKPPLYVKSVSICMTRIEKPLILTNGKFIPLSLNTFTSIVKTSMAYLSMLRNFM